VSLLPLGEQERRRRQRLQRRLVEGLVEFGAGSRHLAEGPLIQLDQQFADGLIEFHQAEKLALAQGRQNPALYDLHSRLGLSLIEYHQLQAVREIPRIGFGSLIRSIRYGGPSTISSFSAPIGEKIESSSMTLMAR
jgi:hypothetical protein